MSRMMDAGRVAVLGLHWQVNVIRREGFFGAMLAEPVRRSGVVARAARFHDRAAAAGVAVVFTRFTVPDDEGDLVRNTDFMRAVAEAQESFRPESSGAQLVPEIAATSGHVVENQKLSGLADNGLPEWLRQRGIDTLWVTGVATSLTVEQSARHGADLGFTVHVIRDCTAAASEDVHEASLATLDLVTAGCRTADQVLATIT